MAASEAAADRPCHVRTISDPPAPHPIVPRLEEKLRTLKQACCISSSTSTATQQNMICNGLRELGDLYSSVDELLRLPSNQRSLSHCQKRLWVEEQLDGSLRLLDLTCSVRDCLAATREHLQDLRSVLRRKGESTAARVQSGKKLRKEVRVCFRLAKHLDVKCGVDHKDWDLMMVNKVLMEAGEMAVGLLKSVLCLLSVPPPGSKPKGSRWPFVGTKEAREMRCVLFSDDEWERNGLDGSIEGLETGLEYLFRKLIQNRVSLLNILSL